MSLLRALVLILCLLPATAWSDEGAPQPPLDFSHSRFAAPDQQQCKHITLVFTGDTKLCGITAQQMAKHGSAWPFRNVRDVLRSADLCFGNCETAITACTQHTPGKSDAAIARRGAFVFKSNPATSGAVLADAGFDVMQLANNHAMDWCGSGLLDTLAALDAAGIQHVGAGSDYASASAPLIVDVQGVKVGLLAYSLIVPPASAAGNHMPGINFIPAYYQPLLRRQIAALRPQVDVLVTCFHWGVEGSTVANQLQRDIAHLCIDSGADLVIGTHPHSFQGIEHYRDGLIAYSLGNFVFTGEPRQLAGGILRVEVEVSGDSPRLDEVALLPCWIKDGVPTPSQDPKLLGQLATTTLHAGSQLAPGEAGWLGVEPVP